LKTKVTISQLIDALILIFSTLLGDFNIDLMQVNSGQKALKKYLITDRGYTQFINQFTTDYHTQIAHVYTNVPQCAQSAGTLESYYSDHDPIYHKHQHISRTMLLKIFASNWGCGLSARTSGHHAVNLHKLTPFSENFTVCVELCSKIIKKLIKLYHNTY